MLGSGVGVWVAAGKVADGVGLLVGVCLEAAAFIELSEEAVS
jgi:hypothetical protein